MQAAGADFLIELVRLTARTSALIFVAALAARAAELLAPPSSPFSQRGAAWKLIGALIVSHTIHFAFVAALVIQTHGQNVVNRGGWILASIVGVLFYVFTVGALVLRRGPPTSRTSRNLAADTMFSIFVGLAFLQTYLGRVGKAQIFAVMVALLGGALVAYIVAVGIHILRGGTPRPVVNIPE